MFHKYWPLFGTAILVVLFYLPILENEFVHYDDYVYIVENPLVKSPSFTGAIRTAFSSEYEQNYAPLLWTTFALVHRLFGDSPYFFHLVSMLAHGGVAFMLVVVARQLGAGSVLAVVLVLFWALHPQRVEAVAWASALKEPLAAFFSLAAVSSWFALRKEPGRKFFVLLSTGAFALALLCKQTPLPLPWILLAWHLLVRDEKEPSLILETLPLLILSGLALGVAVYANRDAVSHADFLGHHSFFDQAKHALAVLAFTLSKAVLPIGLLPDYGVPAGFAFWVMAGVVCAVLILVFYLYAYRKKNELLLLGLLWAAGHWLLVSGIFPTPLEFTADRLTYLPASLLVVALGITWAAHSGSLLVSKCTFTLTLVLGVPSLLLMGQWRNDQSFFDHHLKCQPFHYPSLINRSILLAQDGRSDESIKLLEAAIGHYPQRKAAYQTLVKIHVIRGESDKAMSVQERWHLALPDDPGSASGLPGQ